MGKVLVALVLAIIGVAMIPQIRRYGFVQMGWVIGFIGIAITILVSLAVLKPY